MADHLPPLSFAQIRLLSEALATGSSNPLPPEELTMYSHVFTMLVANRSKGVSPDRWEYLSGMAAIHAAIAPSSSPFWRYALKHLDEVTEANLDEHLTKLATTQED